MKFLNKQTVHFLPESFDVRSVSDFDYAENAIVHIGVGGFHRSHQAYAIAQLLKHDPKKHAKWRITGVGVMPQDKDLIRHLQNQDNLYTLRMVNAAGEENLMVIDAIQDFFHLDTDLNKIIAKIAHSSTKVVSLTITEGGYNYDFEKYFFKMDNESIVHDLMNKDQPRTVFGLFALALQRRKLTNDASIVLLSCDNIIGNGEILKKSLLSFLEAYDVELHDWVKENVTFPNCMVDRITPVPQKENIQDVVDRFGVRDNCLVVSEDYFQWVIEEGDFLADFPPLHLVGVELVDKVLYYEKMKLGILNGGHTLVGLLGYALGHHTIHEAVLNPIISSIYDQYVHEEVIPVLSPINGVDYHQYFECVKTRFSNAMINDSTARIISFTSDKFPKFILLILQKQLEGDSTHSKWASVIVAAWWYYLRKNQVENHMLHVVDNLKSEWAVIFADEEQSIQQFVAYKPVFGNIAQNTLFMQSYLRAVQLFRAGSVAKNLKTIN